MGERGEATAAMGEAKVQPQLTHPPPPTTEAQSPRAAMAKLSLDAYSAPPGGLPPAPDPGGGAAAGVGGGGVSVATGGRVVPLVGGVGGVGFKRPSQLLEFKEGPSQRLSGTPPRGERRRLSHSEVRVCMFTMPQSCVLPLELRPYAHLYATPAGYPYYDPRQLQGGGVTSSHRTKPNPLLQYFQAPTFPVHPTQSRHQQASQLGTGSMHAAPGAFPLKGAGPPAPGPAAGLVQTMHPGGQAPQPWMHQELTPPMYRGDKRSTATHFYSARRQRRAVDTSASAPSSRLPTPTHAAVAAMAPTLPLGESVAAAPAAVPGMAAASTPGGPDPYLGGMAPMPPGLRPSTAPASRASSAGAAPVELPSATTPPNTPSNANVDPQRATA